MSFVCWSCSSLKVSCAFLASSAAALASFILASASAICFSIFSLPFAVFATSIAVAASCSAVAAADAAVAASEAALFLVVLVRSYAVVPAIAPRPASAIAPEYGFIAALRRDKTVGATSATAPVAAFVPLAAARAAANRAAFCDADAAALDAL
jgi:hypothetical protein